MKKLLFTIITVLALSHGAKADDIFTATLLDHVMTVTQIKSGETTLALVDSVVQIGSYNKLSILDLQAGFSNNVKPESNEAAGANWMVGGFFKISTLLKDKIHFPDQWKFLNSLEHGPVYFYDLRTKKDFVGYQIGLAFGLNPKN